MIEQAGSLALKCLTALRKDGLWGFCSRAVDRPELWMTNSAYWCRADLSIRRPRRPRPENARIDFGATEEAQQWLKEIGSTFRWAHDERELKLAQEHSHVYPLLMIHGVKAGYVKVGFSRAFVSDFGTEIQIPVDSAFIYDTFVHPDYRGRGLATILIGELCGFLRRRPTRFAWCHIPTWNRASRTVYRRNGFKMVRHVRFVHFLKWRFYSHHPEAVLRGDAGTPPYVARTLDKG